MPGGFATPLPATALWAAAFVAYLLAARGGGDVPRSVLWVGAIALRLLFVPLEPSFSEDIYRYLWDGWVQLHGLNPFLHAPGDPAVAELATEWSALINHREIPTIYPPAAQFAFMVLATIAPSVLWFKLAFVAADLGIGRLVEILASGRPGARSAAILYLWSPLVVLEVAWSGHMDPIGILPTLGAVALVGGSGSVGAARAAAGAALLGLGAAIKLAPLAAIPALARRRGLLTAAVAGLVFVFLYATYVEPGVRLFEGLGEYARRWEFNPGPFALLDLALPGERAPRLAAAAIVAGVAAWAAWRRFPIGRALFAILGAGLLLTPTLHPWYLCWILPFAALFRSRGWIALTGLAFLSYAGRDVYLRTGDWTQPAWLSVLIWGPPLVLLLWDGFAAQRLAGRSEVAERE